MRTANVLYTGKREPDSAGPSPVSRVDGRVRYLLPARLDITNHSPDGLSWGYAGSGPAQCALAILADYLEHDELARRLHQDFKFDFVAWFPDEWTLAGAQIDAWIGLGRAEIEAKLAPQKVNHADAEGDGCSVVLACGHEAWIAESVAPPEKAPCDVCLDDLVAAVRNRSKIGG